MSGKFKLSQSSLNALEINVPNEIIDGVADAKFMVTLTKDLPLKVVVTSDLKGLEIKIDTLKWRKDKQKKGELVLNITVENTDKDVEFSLSTEMLSANAKINFGSNGAFERLILNNLILTRQFSFFNHYVKLNKILSNVCN